MKFKPTSTLLALTVIAVASGCGFLKPVARTANDIALLTCKNTFGAPGVELPQGVTLEEFCNHHENLQPFIDNILAAKTIVGTAQGVGYKKE